MITTQGKIFKIVCGINTGYYHENEKEINIKEIQKKISEIADEMFDKTGVYFSGILQIVKVSYKSEWGCPAGGEDCFSYEYTYNPAYGEIFFIDTKFLEFANAIKLAFKQTTLTITSHEIEVTYLSEY